MTDSEKIDRIIAALSRYGISFPELSVDFIPVLDQLDDIQGRLLIIEKETRDLRAVIDSLRNPKPR